MSVNIIKAGRTNFLPGDFGLLQPQAPNTSWGSFSSGPISEGGRIVIYSYIHIEDVSQRLSAAGQRLLSIQ